MQQDMIVVLDLGSLDNTLIAREVRNLGVYSEVHPHDISLAELSKLPNIRGVIINGGPRGLGIDVHQEIYQTNLPFLAVAHPSAQGRAQMDTWPEDLDNLRNVLKSFVLKKCQARTNWNMQNFIADQIKSIRNEVGEKKVLLALSGGVDSSVVAALLIKAIGQQLVSVHVNNGLMRKRESDDVVQLFRNQLEANLIYVDASQRFLDQLAGIADPEEKRKIIGAEFIAIFEEEARKLDGIEFLAQGTIYSDIVESGTKTSGTVKSHHNVGGLPEDLKFSLIEPLSHLFKDEVRACGLELGLPEEMVYRQPFPGPGLGVRCLGSIDAPRLEAIRESDAILREEFARVGLDKKVWQYFTVVPDFKSVGIRDNARTYEYPVIIRAVNTVDAMTASTEEMNWSVLNRITQRILKEVPHINRVCYDLTPKPPGTIEWE